MRMIWAIDSPGWVMASMTCASAVGISVAGSGPVLPFCVATAIPYDSSKPDLRRSCPTGYSYRSQIDTSHLRAPCARMHH